MISSNEILVWAGATWPNLKEIQPQIRKSWDSMENANKKRK